MDKLKNALSSADDDYLVGLSNKGTLKRAYKDLDSSDISASYIDGSAYITVGGEKCVIGVPLAESQCTCPSRTVCRHIITSILWLKNNLSGSQEDKEDNKGGKDENPSDEENKSEESREDKKSLSDELAEVPLKTIQKAMKKRYYNSFLEKAKVGFLPSLEELSVITADIPEDNAVVKLLSPLEYSACTCHSKDFCKHKAAAVLTWQIKHKIVDINNLTVTAEPSAKFDIEEAKDTAEYTLEFLFKLLSDGLVRTSENIAEEAESAAVLCHGARLADCERLMREIGNRLSAYISHSPEFNTEMLFSIIMESIESLKKILGENDEKKLESFVGEFRNKYSASDILEIVPIAKRYFSSAAGYEGDVYYFVNKTDGADNKFLTYSDVRPTFYQTSRKSRQSSAPWGLYGSSAELLKSELRLTLPKLSGGKISSSSDTKAEIISTANLNQKAVKELIYTDFSEMISKTFAYESQSENDRLVLIAPKKCISSVSDEITQTHTITLEDCFGQLLKVRTRYKTDNKIFFEQFEKIGKQMLKSPEVQFVIFGNAYIENGTCFIYPIAIFDNIELSENFRSSSPYRIAEGESGYSYFAEHFREVKKMLCDIIQCGINSFDLYEQIFDFSKESEKMGLLSLSKKLYNLGEILHSKNHQSRNDNSEIIMLTADIYQYLSIGTSKTEVCLAIENLNEKEKQSL